MSLTEQLRELAEGSAKRHPGKSQDIMQTAIDELKQLQSGLCTENNFQELIEELR